MSQNLTALSRKPVTRAARDGQSVVVGRQTGVSTKPQVPRGQIIPPNGQPANINTLTLDYQRSRGIIAARRAGMCSKTWLMFATAVNILFLGLMAKLLERVRKQVPVGYQDETGFHYGVPKD